MTVGIDGEPEHQDHVIEDCCGRRIGAGYQVVGELNGVLGVRHLGGVKAAVDVHDHFAVVGERARLVVVESPDQRETPGRLLIFVELGEIAPGRDQRDVPVTPLRCLADAEQLQLVGRGGEFLKVAERFVVTGQEKIVAGFMAENRLRRRDLGGRGGGKQQNSEQPHTQVGYHSCHFRGSSSSARNVWRDVSGARRLLPSKIAGA